MSRYQDFMSDAKSELPNRNDDELTEQFYLLQLFESQYTPDDGDFTTYLFNRLHSYHQSMN